MWKNRSHTRWRTWTWSTLPSSNCAALTMWAFSTSVWLFQNRVAWEKWSLNDSLRSRTFCPVICSGKLRNPSGLDIGHPRPRLFGS